MSEQADGRGMAGWMKILIAIAAVIGLLVAYSQLPLQEWTENLRTWINGLGAIGWVVFALIYAVATLAMFPGSFLTLAAGLAFGLWGFPIVVVGATIGAGAAFLAARYLVRDWVQAKTRGNRTFKAIDSAIEEDGWKIVGLLRLSPAVPFSLQNWMLGTTGVAFWPYLLATFFGIMPGTLLYIWIGSIGGSAAAGGQTSTLKYVFFGIGILATLAVTIIVGRKAKQKLAQHGLAEADS